MIMKNNGKRSTRFNGKMTFSSFAGVIGISAIFLLLSGFQSLSKETNAVQGGTWVAPPEANQLKNPYQGNATATAQGKKVYVTICHVCHGNKGKGDGPAGVSLNPRPANLTSQKVQQQTDGAIFWKMTNGKPPMASYKDMLTPEQRWGLVNYIRQLGNNTRTQAKNHH